MGADWNLRTLSKFRMLRTTSTFAMSIGSSFALEVGSKKWMTPLPERMARAWAVRAMSWASCNDHDCRKVHPEFRTEVMAE